VSFEPPAVRLGLNALLERFPHLVLLRADAWPNGNPWLLVSLGQRSEGEEEAYARHEFAIWKSTGAVYTIGHDGAVGDDPIITV
jgi:hypothetical protein